jgi:large subunit ribosomal protein L25
MADKISLAAQRRPGAGKGEAKKLRREGRVPAVAYGTEFASTPISVNAYELYHALNTDAGLNAIISLELDGGESQLSMPQQVQRDPLRGDPLHIDFVTITRGVAVTVDVPVELEGEAPGVVEGGVADQQLFTLSVEVLPMQVPDQLTLDISDMVIGDVKRVSDVALPADVTVLDDPDTTVVTVNVPTAEMPEPEEALEEGMDAEEAEAQGATADEVGETGSDSAG